MRGHPRLTRAAVALAALWSAASVLAAGAPAVRTPPAKEIGQLIAALGDSGCQFQRNGSWHDARAAQTHLQRKYDWLLERKPQLSAEEFIELGASRSSMSGRPYQVRCPGKPQQPSAQWLRARLLELRARPVDAR